MLQDQVQLIETSLGAVTHTCLVNMIPQSSLLALDTCGSMAISQLFF